jgi:protein-L-isoaspartate O-methyltransferase
MPRHGFLPDAVWAWDPDAQSQVRIDRFVEPDRWLEQVYRDEPVVTQWDGRPDGSLGTVATSSSPRPSVVVRTLAELNPREGMQVWHIGTGAGWTPAMTNHRTGPGTVISMEIDPIVAEAAQQRLRRASSDVMVLPGETPHSLHLNLRYDRLLYSFARDRITPDVFDLVNDGAVVLAPWAGPWLRFGIANLTVRSDVADRQVPPLRLLCRRPLGHCALAARCGLGPSRPRRHSDALGSVAGAHLQARGPVRRGLATGRCRLPPRHTL